jgi:hypothetical protein
MPRARPEEIPVGTRIFVCLLCEEKPKQESGKEFGDHCRERHPEVISEEGTVRGFRHTLSHVDGATWYSWQYLWKTKEGKEIATETATFERAKNDPMRFDGE